MAEITSILKYWNNPIEVRTAHQDVWRYAEERLNVPVFSAIANRMIGTSVVEVYLKILWLTLRTK